jgi:spore germination cell wall hydrolase CwlJ-like protein
MINEILCLSAIMFGEARGESDVGKVAVAFTAINRKADPSYPKDICQVMNQPYQYEFLSKYGMPSKQQVAYLMPLAEAILKGKINDPTRGAKFFHTKQIAKPIWAKQKEIKIALGNHIFY